jgi:cell division protein FtsZ
MLCSLLLLLPLFIIVFSQAAAEESREEIAAAIGDAHMVFITAGMGGGTGTGAAPVIADVCREKGVLRVAVVTKPFRTEGRHRTKLAIEGMKALHDLVDTMIVIPNDNIFKLADLSTPIVDAYSLADDVCLAGVKSITDLMIKPGRINLDFADVRTVMKDMGNAVMGTGQAEGEDRAVKATIDALRNPLLGGDMSIRTAKGVLVNVTSGSDFTLGEWQQVTEKIIDEVEDEDAAVIMGHSIDNSMGDSIRVSIVATGIDLE